MQPAQKTLLAWLQRLLYSRTLTLRWPCAHPPEAPSSGMMWRSSGWSHRSLRKQCGRRIHSQHPPCGEGSTGHMRIQGACCCKQLCGEGLRTQDIPEESTVFTSCGPEALPSKETLEEVKAVLRFSCTWERHKSSSGLLNEHLYFHLVHHRKGTVPFFVVELSLGLHMHKIL